MHALIRYALFIILINILTPFHGVAGSAPISDYGEAINQAGRQRMLSQRAVKAYAQIGQKVYFAKPDRQLKDSLNLYQTQLDNLTAFARGGESQAALRRAARVWEEFEKIARDTVSRDYVVKLNKKSEELLQASQAVVQALVKEAGTEGAHIVDISGRQRMLSQRMAKYYLLLSWGLDDPQYREEFNKAEQEFSAAMNELSGSIQNTPEIKEGLTGVEKQWRFFQLTKIMDSDQYLPSIVARTTESLLQDMNRITGMYAKIAGN